jgi:iron complex outermembrane receptor protein
MTARRSFSAGVRYRLPLPTAWGEVVANADEYYTSATAFSGTTLPPYAVLNMRLDYNNIEGGPVDVGIFVRNATDRRYAQAPVASGAFLGITSAIYGPPRMYGLEFRVRFGK